jgi:O-acetyl-ADP-ribose deacetylase (regulator of RNase III)
MIYYTKGDIFDSKAQAIVNPVNCVGVMGAGLAKQFKNRCHRSMFFRYKTLCDKGELRPGTLMYFQDNDKMIVNFPTKDDWRNPSKLKWIEDGLINFVKNYKAVGIKSIAFPPLGARLGGLDWNDVDRLMLKYLADLPIDVYIYQPK